MPEGGATSFEVSSTYVGGLVRSLRKLTLLTPEVQQALGPEQHVMIASPHSRSWWDGALTLNLVEAVLTVHGPARLEEAGLDTTTTSVGPIITPLLSVIGAIFGLDPSEYFSRIGDLASTSVRNVSFEWKSTSRSTGELRVAYPRSVSAQPVEPLWRGACRFIFQTSRVPGEIVSSHIDGSTITISLKWPRG